MKGEQNLYHLVSKLKLNALNIKDMKDMKDIILFSMY